MGAEVVDDGAAFHQRHAAHLCRSLDGEGSKRRSVSLYGNTLRRWRLNSPVVNVASPPDRRAAQAGQRDSRPCRRQPSVDAPQPLALHLAERPSRPEGTDLRRSGHDGGGQAHHNRGALRVQVGDRRHYGARGSWPEPLPPGDDRRDRPDHRLRGSTHRHGVDHASARRAVRVGRYACRASSRDGCLRPPARLVAALPPRAQDGWADAGSRARAHGHRDDRSDGDADRRADHRRVRDDPRRVPVPVQLALCAGGHADDRRLHGVHHHRDQLADHDPQVHERERSRRPTPRRSTACSTSRP